MLKCPTEITPFITTILSVAVELVAYDPVSVAGCCWQKESCASADLVFSCLAELCRRRV